MYGVPVSCCEQVIEDHCSYSALGKSHDGFHRLLLLHPYGQCSCSICFIAQEERNIDHTHICTHTHMCEHTHTQRKMNTHTVGSMARDGWWCCPRRAHTTSQL